MPDEQDKQIAELEKRIRTLEDTIARWRLNGANVLDIRRSTLP